jgi:hypothetical protein
LERRRVNRIGNLVKDNGEWVEEEMEMDFLCNDGEWVNKAEEEDPISGVKICHATPSVSHLLFADDSLILVRAKGRKLCSCRISWNYMSDALAK